LLWQTLHSKAWDEDAIVMATARSGRLIFEKAISNLTGFGPLTVHEV
jgi:hypothetical protein